MKKLFFATFLILTSCVSKQTAEPKSKVELSPQASSVIEFDEKVSGICVNIVNQLMMVENVQLIEYNPQEGFVVLNGSEKESLGFTCLFSSKKSLKNYKEFPKASIKCMLDTYLLESTNYYVKSKKDGLIEMYNSDYNRSYITHAKACFLVKEGEGNSDEQ